MFTFPTSMFNTGIYTPPESTLLEKTIAYFTFDDTTSDLFSPDSTGNYRFYFQYDSANYITGLAGSATQPGLDSSVSEMYVQKANGSDLDTDANFNVSVSGFMSVSMWFYHEIGYSGSSIDVFGNFDEYNSDYGFRLTYDDGTYNYYPSVTTTDEFGNQYVLTHTSPIYTGQWNFIGLEVNIITGEYKIRFNDQAPVTASGVFSIYGGAYSQPGFFNPSSFSSFYYAIDRLHFCNAPLTDTEWDYLYDSGSGTTSYPFS